MRRPVYLATLAAGASVTFDITVTLSARAQGTATNTFSASVLQGPAAVVASNSTAVVDNRGGAYTAFTSDGDRVGVAADFVGDTLTFSGNGADVAAPFTLQSFGSAYLTGANSSLLAHRDLLGCTAPRGGGTPVFIAGRTFIASIAALDGHAFNTFEIDSPTGGTPASRVPPAVFSGSTMQVCADSAFHTIATCPAASLRHYDLTLADTVFTGIDAADADTVTFQVAQSNGTLVLLRAAATSVGRVFQVDLSANPGIVSNLLHGGDTAGHWGNLNLNPGTLQENRALPDGSTISQYDADRVSVAGAPAGVASSALAAGPIYLAEDGDIAILMGQPGGGVDGLLQLFAY